MQVHPRYTAPESTERSLSTVPSIATFRSFLLVSIFLWTASLTPQARAQTVQPEEVPLSFAPFHSTGIYNVGETVGWRVTPLEAGSTGKYRYTVRRNNQAILQSGKLDLASGSATIELNASEPEMLLVDVVPDVATPSKSAPQETMVGAAVSPMSLKPSVPCPADFLDFWRDKLAQLATVPINPRIKPVASPKPGVDLSIVTLDSLGSHAHGYLAKPSHPGKYPALVVYQWAGVYKLNPGVAAGYANDGWLTFNVDSHDMEPTEANTVSADYAMIGDNDRDQSYFLKMFLRDTRALDYIATLPEWDGKTIVLTGASMGGWQSLATAGLNPDRVTSVIVVEPAGLDTNADLHGRKAGYPYWPSNDFAVMNTALYFDPVNFAPQIKAATTMAAGFLDTTAPPAGIYTAFNLIHAPKEFVPMPDSSHHDAHPAETQATFFKRQKEVLDTILHPGSVPLP